MPSGVSLMIAASDETRIAASNPVAPSSCRGAAIAEPAWWRVGSLPDIGVAGVRAAVGSTACGPAALLIGAPRCGRCLPPLCRASRARAPPEGAFALALLRLLIEALADF